jgi:glucose-1-phosphate cytidylyltransferase
VKAVIVSGPPATDDTHRPLIGGKPIAWHIMRRLAAFAITDFILCGPSLGGRELWAEAESGWQLQVLPDGGLKQAEPFIEEDLFVVAYGNGLADIDVAAMLAFSRAQGRLATVTAVRPADEYLPAGFFVLRRGVFDYLDRDSVLDHEPLVALAEDGELCAYRHDGFWQQVADDHDGTVLNELWAAGRAPWAA